MAVIAPPRSPTGERFLGLDAVRGLALLCVIAIHADHWPLQDAGADRAVWSQVDVLARVAVPWFVMLSGFLLTCRGTTNTSAGAFLGRRLGRSLLPWIVWMPVYALVGLFLTSEIPHGWPEVAGWLELGAGHLWFLVLIPQLYVVFLVWPRSARGAAVAGAVALLVQVGLCVYRLYAPGDAPLNGVFLPFGFELGVFWIGYFGVGAALGAWLAGGAPRWPAWPFWLAVPAAAWLLVWIGTSGAANPSFAQGTGAFLSPALPLLVVPSFLAVALSADRFLTAHQRLRRATVALSELSLGVYIVHEALLYVPGRLLAPVLDRDLPVSIVGVGLLVVATLGLAVLVTRLLVATPLAVMVGSRRVPLRPGPAAELDRDGQRDADRDRERDRLPRAVGEDPAPELADQHGIGRPGDRGRRVGQREAPPRHPQRARRDARHSAAAGDEPAGDHEAHAPLGHLLLGPGEAAAGLIAPEDPRHRPATDPAAQQVGRVVPARGAEGGQGHDDPDVQALTVRGEDRGADHDRL